MAWPTTQQKSKALARADGHIQSMKRAATAWLSAMQGGTMTSESAHAACQTLLQVKSELDSVAAIPGIAAFATDDLGEDVTTAFVEITGAMTPAFTSLRDAIPTHQGSPKFYTMDSLTALTPVLLTGTTTAQANVQALLDAIG